MRRSRQAYISLFVALGLFAIAGTAESANAPVQLIVETEAVATFDSFDVTGTIETTVTLNSFNYTDAQAGQPLLRQNQTGLNVYIFDHKANSVLLVSQGATDKQILFVDPELKKAHLKCSCVLTDGTQSTFTAQVDVTWQIPAENPAKVTSLVDTSVPGTVTTSCTREEPAHGVIRLDKSTQYPHVVNNAIPSSAAVGDNATELAAYTEVSR